MVRTPLPRDRLEDRGGKDDEVPREVWKKVEGRKANEAGLEKAGKTGREERKKETRDRESENDRKNNGRGTEYRGGFDRVEDNR